MAARTRSRPLYAVFLERVIQIAAVQRHRAAVTDEGMKPFFSEGRLPRRIGESLWCLEGSTVPQLYVIPVSLPMQHARDAAIAAFKEFIAALVNGELIASGVYAASGFRCDLDRVEWTRTDLMLDVRNGDLIEATIHASRVQWSSIVVRAVTKRSSPTAKRGPSLVDWDLLMTYGVLLREASCLPSKHASLTANLKALAKLLFRVDADEADLRRLTRDIYAGRRKRRKRKRER